MLRNSPFALSTFTTESTKSTKKANQETIHFEEKEWSNFRVTAFTWTNSRFFSVLFVLSVVKDHSK
jgi:hypothetical protein